MSIGWFLFGGLAGAAAAHFGPQFVLGARPEKICRTTFRRVPNGSPEASTLAGEISAPYKALVQAFGEPDLVNHIDYKSFNQWVFEGPGGTYSIYDYRDDGSKKRSYKWHLGGRDFGGTELFVAWLARTLKQK